MNPSKARLPLHAEPLGEAPIAQAFPLCPEDESPRRAPARTGTNPRGANA